MRGQRNPKLKPRVVSVRLTEYLSDTLDRYAAALGTTKTALIESAISRYIYHLEENKHVQAKVKQHDALA